MKNLAPSRLAGAAALVALAALLAAAMVRTPAPGKKSTGRPTSSAVTQPKSPTPSDVSSSAPPTTAVELPTTVAASDASTAAPAVAAPAPAVDEIVEPTEAPQPEQATTRTSFPTGPPPGDVRSADSLPYLTAAQSTSMLDKGPWRVDIAGSGDTDTAYWQYFRTRTERPESLTIKTVVGRAAPSWLAESDSQLASEGRRRTHIGEFLGVESTSPTAPSLELQVEPGVVVELTAQSDGAIDLTAIAEGLGRRPETRPGWDMVFPPDGLIPVFEGWSGSSAGRAVRWTGTNGAQVELRFGWDAWSDLAGRDASRPAPVDVRGHEATVSVENAADARSYRSITWQEQPHLIASIVSVGLTADEQLAMARAVAATGASTWQSLPPWPSSGGDSCDFLC